MVPVVSLGRKAKPREILSAESKWVSPTNFVITIEAEGLTRYAKGKTIKLYLSDEQAQEIANSIIGAHEWPVTRKPTSAT